jgi:CRISPR/Cas system-associated endonuclease Cas3-HD
MQLKVAFVVMLTESNPEKHRSIINTPVAELTTVCVKDIEEAVKISKELVEKGINAIELCSAFGNNEVARISEVVGKNIIVGVVRFDLENSAKFRGLVGL